MSNRVPLQLEISQDDINAGQQRNEGFRSRSCPVAQALRRRFPGNDISVGVVGASVGGFWFPLPSSLQRFIEVADSAPTSDEVEPITVTINVPSMLLDQVPEFSAPGDGD